MEVMNCPKCQVPMREREQNDVIIDICPRCRGVWLDPGELEKLSVRESRYYDDDDDDWDDRRRGDYREPGRPYEGERRYEGDRRYEGSRGYPPKKKKSFLSSMMESFGGEGGDD